MTSDDSYELLTKLAGGLIHEIKNPLSTLDINLQLLAEEWAGEEGDRERRALRKIELLRKEVRRLEGILRDFLDFARSGVVHVEDVDLSAMCRDVLAFVGPDLTARKIRSWLKIEDELPRVPVDPTLIKQALLNLILNARDSMTEGGELIIRGRRDGDWALLEVLDTGLGISPDKLEKIFEVYYSSKPQGTGLGLPTTRRIVEQHGGRLEVESEEGMGTRFCIRLPLRSTPSGAATSGRIAVVADETAGPPPAESRTTGAGGAS